MNTIKNVLNNAIKSNRNFFFCSLAFVFGFVKLSYIINHLEDLGFYKFGDVTGQILYGILYYLTYAFFGASIYFGIRMFIKKEFHSIFQKTLTVLMMLISLVVVIVAILVQFHWASFLN